MKQELTLEQSKMLVERGVFYTRWSYDDCGRRIPRFNVCDLLEQLPQQVEVVRNNVKTKARLHIIGCDSCWKVSYSYYHKGSLFNCCCYNNEEVIDGLYNALLWVVEKGYLETEEK